MIVQEAIHSIRTQSGKKKMFAIKVDLEKAYDHLNWDLIHEAFYLTGLSNNFVGIIMDFICSANYFVLWEGEPTKCFIPSQGIRQGDPLSSYIFTLCIERLVHIITDEIHRGN